MSISTSEIGWGSYLQWEGPYFWGKKKYIVPQNPSFLEKALAVTTSTEGGTLDSVNMYDRCILSCGIIQYCEAVFALSRMLGSCADAGCLGILRSTLSTLPVPADLVKDLNGKWHFSFLDGRGIVDNPQKLQAMFLAGSSGLKGQWTQVQKDSAIKTASIFASIWDNEFLCDAQISYASRNLWGSVGVHAKQALSSVSDEEDWAGALKAAIISYSANLPANADAIILKVSQTSVWQDNDQEKYFAVCKALALNSGIGIWPERYKKISPVIGRLFNVSVPSLQDLSQWTHESDPDPASVPSDDDFSTIVGIQKFLISQNYDLGPSAADGKLGPKTTLAVKDFQSHHGLTPDGVVGPKTIEVMRSL